MIPYSQEAHRWFAALGRNKDAVRATDPPFMGTWMRLTIDGGRETYTVPIMYGSEEATLASLQYVLSLPKVWERLGVKEMTVLQALEVKNRALIMGDVTAAIRHLIESGLLPEKFEGVAKVKNPYNYMSVVLARRIEELDKDIPRVSCGAPKRWETLDCMDEYDIRTFRCPDRGHGIGLAITNDTPDVSPFDVAGSIALGKVG